MQDIVHKNTHESKNCFIWKNKTEKCTVNYHNMPWNLLVQDNGPLALSTGILQNCEKTKQNKKSPNKNLSTLL